MSQFREKMFVFIMFFVFIATVYAVIGIFVNSIIMFLAVLATLIVPYKIAFYGSVVFSLVLFALFQKRIYRDLKKNRACYKHAIINLIAIPFFGYVAGSSILWLPIFLNLK